MGGDMPAMMIHLIQISAYLRFQIKVKKTGANVGLSFDKSLYK